MRVYLSGPITGHDNFMEEFEKHEKMAREKFGCEVVNPAKVNSNMPDTLTWDQYMAMAFAMMSVCDTIVMMPGWEDSKGAKLELICAALRDFALYASDGNDITECQDITLSLIH